MMHVHLNNSLCIDFFLIAGTQMVAQFEQALIALRARVEVLHRWRRIEGVHLSHSLLAI